MADIEEMARRTSPSQGGAGNEPELPRIIINTDYVPPAGKTIAVAAGGDFQAALNQALPGDIITLAAGTTYTGNFVLPAKAGSEWIVIRTSAPDSSLPPPGTRITPAAAASLPKIVTPNSAPALQTTHGAHHYRFIGLEVAQAAGVNYTYSLVELGNGNDQVSLAQVPHNLIFDRIYLHGSPATTLRRAIALNSAWTSIIDSYISDCHEVGADSQAIGGWNGPGPFKIVNNYLEGAGENFILGGADPKINNLVPSDIEFRRNHCFKPLSWRIGDPSYAGTPWTVKNSFELKNAQRILIEGNIFEHNWTQAQNGYAILFTVRNQDGASPWSVVQDVTFVNNIVRSVGAGFNMHGTDDLQTSLPSQRIKIANNLLEGIDRQRWDGPGVAFQLNGGPNQVTIENNTVIHTGNVIATAGTPSETFVYRNNLSPHNEYGVKGDGEGSGNQTINRYFPNSVFIKNILIAGPSGSYPLDNLFPATTAQVGFVDFAGQNYRLSASSPYKNAGTDGKDIGCDFDLLFAAINGIPGATNVSAASYIGAALAPESIATAFGTGLSSITLASQASPLPELLGGTSVIVRDRLWVERLGPLFFVSPTQVNYMIPPNTATGMALITIKNGENIVASSTIQIDNVAPGIFTTDATGRGLPAALILRVRSDGTQQYEPIASFDASQNKFVPVPINLGSGTDQVYLILFATGLRFRSSLSAVNVSFGGVPGLVTFAGSQGVLFGLDQINVLLPAILAGRGDIEVGLGVDGKTANIIRITVL
ncbi:MAG: right-handed parallel beta-helix repeat-containing protein [Acidobacteria bacterium]|nr:right-handed parallel beta-helix repeat-containing protein [Acidobacteriota bacterium]